MTNADCIADIEQPEVVPANKRRLTVSYASRHPGYTRIPALTLKGQWLEAAGFATGTEVEARVMNGCIVLTAKEPEPELLASLRGVEKLSVRKQKQVKEFIVVVSGKGSRVNGLRHG